MQLVANNAAEDKMQKVLENLSEGKLMKEECLICKAPLEYLEKDILMECEICHKKENSKTRCINRHRVRPSYTLTELLRF